MGLKYRKIYIHMYIYIYTYVYIDVDCKRLYIGVTGICWVYTNVSYAYVNMYVFQESSRGEGLGLSIEV